MQKKMFLSIVVFLVVFLSGSSALALTLMGQPTASLKEGQSSGGGEYTYSKMDIDIEDLTPTEDVETNAYLAYLGWGITDNWEASVRVGAVGVDIENIDDVSSFDLDGNTKFSYGFGTKATFMSNDRLSWGALFQIIWEKSEDICAYGYHSYEFEINFYEIQIAAGPTYETDGMCIYGGPFMHFLDGDLKVSMPGKSESFDMKQESEFGGYVGTQSEIGENCSANLEVQYTDNSWAIGGRIVWELGP